MVRVIVRVSSQSEYSQGVCYSDDLTTDYANRLPHTHTHTRTHARTHARTPAHTHTHTNPLYHNYYACLHIHVITSAISQTRMSVWMVVTNVTKTVTIPLEATLAAAGLAGPSLVTAGVVLVSHYYFILSCSYILCVVASYTGL